MAAKVESKKLGKNQIKKIKIKIKTINKGVKFKD